MVKDGMAEILKFSILNSKEQLSSKYEVTSMLINIDHIVSIKPINIVVSGNLLKGFWVRLSNGKKYKALNLPEKLAEILADDSDSCMELQLNDKNFSDDSEIDLMLQ